MLMPETFVIVLDDNTIALATERRVSNMFDLADCDAMDHVTGVYAVDEKGDLVKVHLGPQTRTNDWDAFYYARAPIMAGTRQVGFIHLTDH